MWDLIISVPDHCLSFYLTMCLLRSQELSKPRFQRSHFIERSLPSWILRCFLRHLLSLNALAQYLHETVASEECNLSWSLHLVLWTNCLSQTRHLNFFCPRCVTV